MPMPTYGLAILGSLGGLLFLISAVMMIVILFRRRNSDHAHLETVSAAEEGQKLLPSFIRARRPKKSLVDDFELLDVYVKKHEDAQQRQQQQQQQQQREAEPVSKPNSDTRGVANCAFEGESGETPIRRRRSSLPSIAITVAPPVHNQPAPVVREEEAACTLQEPVAVTQKTDPVKDLDDAFLADFPATLGYPVTFEGITVCNEATTMGEVSDYEDGKSVSGVTLKPLMPPQGEDIKRLVLPPQTLDPDMPSGGLLISELDLVWPHSEAHRSIKTHDLRDDQFVLKTIVHEVHCILGSSVGLQHAGEGRKAARFYVKARLTKHGLASAASYSSILSLDQLTGGSNHHTQVVTGRTPMQSAMRTLLFKRCILLPIPTNWMDESSGLPMDLRLKIDLKECQMNSLKVLLPNRNVVATAEVNLGSQMWRFLQRSDILLIDSPPSLDLGQLDEAGDCEAQPQHLHCRNRRVIFAKPLLPKDRDVVCGHLKLAIRYHSTLSQLQLRLVQAELLSIPKGCSYVYARCTLMNNAKVLRSFDTQKATSIAFSEVQFKQDETSSVTLVDDLISNMCLLITMMAKMKSHVPSVALGRCVIGSRGLAYGSGLKHWQEAIENPGKYSRMTHTLF